MTWQQSAACRDADPDLFFPVGPTAGQVVKQTVEQYCRGCPSLLPCRDAGRDEYGIWGGRIGAGQARDQLDNRAYQQRLRRARITAEGAARLAALVAEHQEVAS